MVDDKYVGLALAIAGTFAIGSSFIVTKMGLNAVAKHNTIHEQSSEYRYLINPLWWAGIILMVTGELANFAAYAFAPAILVTPLGAMSVIIGAVLASWFLKEELGPIGRAGCGLCVIGSLIIILHAPEDKNIQTVDEILQYAIQPGFLLYSFVVLVFSLAMIYYVAPLYGTKIPLVYISICSVVGSMSVMAIKGFGIALKLTVAGNNQLTHPSTYVFGIVVVVCILVQMNYFNKALAIFSTNVVNPTYFVTFSTSVIIASTILFQGFNTTNATVTLTLLLGFVVTFVGVHLLNISRIPEPPPLSAENIPLSSSALETGIMNPRLSISGRVSQDGWPPSAGGIYNGGHSRRGSVNSTYHPFPTDRQHSLAFSEDHTALHMERLREEDEDDDADENTRLTGRSQVHRIPSSDKSRRVEPAPRIEAEG
ncbi:hypothetical protein M408DRAFT_59914 [Serendipita vermifera MAFF 305830]|uniref:Magnesium transporter n=1 Tax=Serendipita vermifera MAFF 305830 TaxID=933852 RepID=A0A0C2Y045_SERVB|nr:hypothetical protein M408DRAFT_59914 [Serendipita vermifera MAFF 305830]